MTDSFEVMKMKLKSLEDQCETMTKIILTQKQRISELEAEIENAQRRIVKRWVGTN